MTVITWEGPEVLRQHLVPVDEVMPHPDNYRRGRVERIAESLRRFGQMRPILVWEERRLIVAGNHTYRGAVEELSWTHIAALLVPMTEADAKAYLVADNRLSDLATNDDDALAAALASLEDEDRYDGTGWTPDEYEDLMANLNRLAQAPTLDDGGGQSARRAPGSDAGDMREVVLMYDARRHAQFGRFLSMLGKEFDTTGPSDTAYEAIKRAAEAL